MRVNGRAAISTDPDLCGSFAMRGHPATSVIVVTVDAVYPQCPKALVRGKIWDETAKIPKNALPSVGEMMQALDAGFDGEAYEAAYPARMERTIY
jgi:uncharacterized protein